MYYIGLDIGGMSIKGGISVGDDKIIYKEAVPTQSDKGYDAVLQNSANLIDLLISKTSVNKSDIAGVGIGIPGTVSKGIVINAPNIGMNNKPFAEDLQKLTGLKIVLENDANCAALCEYKFGKNVSDNLLLVTIGTGIGTGIICDGKLLTGFNGIAGEGGHITIKVNGRKCACGRRGCFEKYSSTSALLYDVKMASKKYPNSILAELSRDKIDGFTIFKALDRNCEVAKKVMDTYITNLAIGIANLVNICGSEIVLIGGGISEQKERLIDPLRIKIDSELKRNIDNGVRTLIYPATFGNNAGILGAIIAAKLI